MKQLNQDGQAENPSFDWGAWLLRVVLFVIAGGVTGAALAGQAREPLTFLAGAGGGYLAHRLFKFVKENPRIGLWTMAVPADANVFVRALHAVVAYVFFSPAYTSTLR